MFRKVCCCTALLLPLTVMAQSDQWYHVGRIISTSFLHHITNPERTEFRVGIVNVEGDKGMLVSPEGSSPVIEYIGGNESWLWATAAEQLEFGDRSSIRFEIVRKTIDADVCPALGEAHSRFYRELSEALTEDIPLESLPERIGPEFMTLDGTNFVMQLYTGRNRVTIQADRDINRELHQAAYDLHHIVSGCSNDVEGVIEEHYR